MGSWLEFTEEQIPGVDEGSRMSGRAIDTGCIGYHRVAKPFQPRPPTSVRFPDGLVYPSANLVISVSVIMVGRDQVLDI